MSKNGTTVSTQDKETETRGVAVEATGPDSEGGELATDAAARRPVRPARPSRPAGGPNKNKPSKPNRGNRSSRAMRESGENRQADEGVSPEVAEGEEAEEEEDEEAVAGRFWDFLVAGAYSSRKARGDWGGEGEG